MEAGTPEAEGTEALLAALRLQLDWGADEALLDQAPDRLVPVLQPRAPAPVAPAAAPPPRPAASVPPAASGPQPPALTRAAALAAQAATLEELRAAIAGFEGSTLRETATSMVFADGEPGAPLMFIGEAPGADEDRLGKPFVGASGQLLDRMLASIGLARGPAAYITNILPYRPPGNRTPTDAEITLFLPFLLRHVALARPQRLVLLGATAARSILRTKDGITRLRGRWTQVMIEEDLRLPALATLHPAYLLRTPIAKRDAWADLLLLRRTIDTPISTE